MTTSPLTISVDAEAAKAYAAASEQERRKIEFLLSLRLRELVAPADPPQESGADRAGEGVAEAPRGQDRLAKLRQACGIWRDRDDLPDFEALRREWDRF